MVKEKRMIITEMTRKEFEALLHRSDIPKNLFGLFDSLVILPLRRKHESGYRCTEFVAVIKDEPICRLSGCSDVIHFDGIGGYGMNWLKRFGKVPNSIESKAWQIDSLPKSGLLRIYLSNCEKMQLATDDMTVSSFCLYAEPRL